MNNKPSDAEGAAADGKIFVNDEIGTPFNDKLCEVYNETTDQWQLKATLKIPEGSSIKVL